MLDRPQEHQGISGGGAERATGKGRETKAIRSVLGGDEESLEGSEAKE